MFKFYMLYKIKSFFDLSATNDLVDFSNACIQNQVIRPVEIFLEQQVLGAFGFFVYICWGSTVCAFCFSRIKFLNLNFSGVVNFFHLEIFLEFLLFNIFNAQFQC
eukprot:TRINITY_DN23162_c0_g2_i3.p3 TRINITY_DN23162_c0_g2~~TRINITY_DN23162_c0_g2_i3.p3  ORF type:complete len:105 (-),score=4.23 TRINITY_DN23162_c0_g2_i3:400-714(-)